MSSVDINKDKKSVGWSNGQYGKRDYFSLGLSSEQQFVTAKEFEKQLDENPVFKNPLDAIPGATKMLTGAEDVAGGVGAAVIASRVGQPVAAAVGAIFAAKGVVVFSAGLGVALWAGYEAAKEYFSSKPQPSSFHLVDPKDLSFDGSTNDRKSKESNHLLDTEKVDTFFKEMNDRLEKTMDSVKETCDRFREGRESKMGGLSERSIGETGNHHLSENRNRD